MQNLSQFQGLQIAMDFNSKQSPQIQVAYKNIIGIFSIESGKLIDILNGELDDFPMREEKLINAWISIHKDELLKNWQILSNDKSAKVSSINPLQ